ncbi:hypothetical protein [Deinococcus rubellus]|uniref:Uncharacterized protein n=1 Tax=Deinococcus rubellus TaxID=1889240 RepID=A0ABY5YI68_9DEIO|nr:hypothetical protein [Deinococcus rubellus]UWX64820.1 hypothetical protein N0D28_03915 [Deinococcus rubellus]
MLSFQASLHYCVALTLLLTLSASLAKSPPTSFVTIQGHLANPEQVRRLLPVGTPAVWLTNLVQGRLVGRAVLNQDSFYLPVPLNLRLPLQPFQACYGVSAVPASLQTYQAETMLLYSFSADRIVGPLVQADDPRTPVRSSRWVCADRAATVRGRCTGLNTHYNLKFQRGWNAVMTVSQTGNFSITNLDRLLPYWLLDDFKLNKASSTLPAQLFKDNRSGGQ